MIILNIKLEDIEKAIVAGGNDWKMQNNTLDRKTKFIYYVDNFDTLKLLCNTTLSQEKTDSMHIIDGQTFVLLYIVNNCFVNMEQKK